RWRLCWSLALRFGNCGKQVAGYLGLIPCEDSSAESWRLGHIGKQGNALLRFLLGQAAHSAAMPFEYEGRNLVARFCASIFGAGRRLELVRTRANGQPAVGAYLR